ncbi:phytanoyl-CoA dioxygenase family protein [Pseudoalteromonas sp. PPB1]|uniref:phytanoyl-CoA dioxygenase family protein n=1 Tax=Pseudoalteromonas sp. PPB1 TaxID=2756136 RepID=UPI001890EA2A|nr:phytanoyl-CoA dioxygenase family protein [Pseudoalteromonas sp. PPB1]
MTVKNFFSENGYAVFDQPILDIDLLLKAKQGVKQVLEKEYQTGVQPWCHFGDGNSELTRLTQIHMSDERIYQAITQSQIGNLAAKLTGASKINVWGCQLFYKPSGSQSKGNVGFHRDSQHMPFFKKGTLTAWIPLVDINSNSGPLVIIPGSHTWEPTLEHTGGEIQNMNSQVPLLQNFYKTQNWKEEQVTLPLGGISFHDFNALHGSYPNESPTDRIVITVGLFTDEVEFDNNVEDYGYALVINDERFCPIIYERE